MVKATILILIGIAFISYVIYGVIRFYNELKDDPEVFTWDKVHFEIFVDGYWYHEFDMEVEDLSPDEINRYASMAKQAYEEEHPGVRLTIYDTVNIFNEEVIIRGRTSNKDFVMNKKQLKFKESRDGFKSYEDENDKIWLTCFGDSYFTPDGENYLSKDEVEIINQKEKKKLKFDHITHGITYYLDEEGNKWQELTNSKDYRRSDDDSIRLSKDEVEEIYHDFDFEDKKPEKTKLKKVDCNVFVTEDGVEYVESGVVKLGKGHMYSTADNNKALYETEIELVDSFGNEKENNNVEHPNHYTQNKIECIDYIRDSSTKEEFTGYCINNAKKYIHRWKDKNGIEDIKKAIKHLEWLVEFLED